MTTFLYCSYFRFFFQDDILGFRKELCKELKDFLIEEDTKTQTVRLPRKLRRAREALKSKRKSF